MTNQFFRPPGQFSPGFSREYSEERQVVEVAGAAQQPGSSGAGTRNDGPGENVGRSGRRANIYAWPVRANGRAGANSTAGSGVTQAHAEVVCGLDGSLESFDQHFGVEARLAAAASGVLEVAGVLADPMPECGQSANHIQPPGSEDAFGWQTQMLFSSGSMPWDSNRAGNNLPMTRVTALGAVPSTQPNNTWQSMIPRYYQQGGGSLVNNTPPLPPRNTSGSGTPTPPPDPNSSIWIINLPRGTTEQMILEAITAAGPFGKVYSTAIVNGGQGNNNNNNTKKKNPLPACAISFFDRPSAKRLLFFILNKKTLRIQGQIITHAYWNKKVVIPPPLKSACSRVLIIQGPETFVRVQHLEEYLAGNGKSSTKGRYWKTQHVEVIENIYRVQEGGHRTAAIIWTFASYLGQAELVSMSLREGFSPAINVVFGADPVEFGLARAREMNLLAARMRLSA